MNKLFLYTTLGCHLCEDAKAILWPLLDNFSLTLVEIEIADSDVMIERYGVRIPVIQQEGSEAELGWPFDETQALDFLKLTSL